jgi:hypothetical protein
LFVGQGLYKEVLAHPQFPASYAISVRPFRSLQSRFLHCMGHPKPACSLLIGCTNLPIRDLHPLDNLSILLAQYTRAMLGTHKAWILFFDEADTLFGKRTNIRDAHDKYINQELVYLLQHIENYNGLVILVKNQRANLDEAFGRQFQAIIHFPLPHPEERTRSGTKPFSPSWKSPRTSTGDRWLPASSSPAPAS